MLEGELKALTSHKFSDLLKNRSEEEVIRLIGAPGVFTGPIAGRDQDGEMQQKWLYFMGYWRTGLCISFIRGHCFSAKVCYKEQRRDMEMEAFKDIKAFSVGKSESVISQYLRTPLKPQIRDLKVLDSDQGQSKAMPAEMVYGVGDDYDLNFYFVDDKCDRVEIYRVLR